MRALPIALDPHGQFSSLLLREDEVMERFEEYSEFLTCEIWTACKQDLLLLFVAKKRSIEGGNAWRREEEGRWKAVSFFFVVWHFSAGWLMTASDVDSFIGWRELHTSFTASGSQASEWVFEIIVTREPEFRKGDVVLRGRLPVQKDIFYWSMDWVLFFAIINNDLRMECWYWHSRES